MRLVECLEGDEYREPPPNVTVHKIRDGDYAIPTALQNLDKEMETILNDTTTDIAQKWPLYHQALQRYLGFVKRMHNESHATGDNISSESIKTAPAVEPLNASLTESESRRFLSRRSVGHVTSTPKNKSKLESVEQRLSTLPIRIKKRLMRQLKQQQQLRQIRRKKDESDTSHSYVSDEEAPASYTDADDGNEIVGELSSVYEDGENSMKIFKSPSAAVVNGWQSSNIEK